MKKVMRATWCWIVCAMSCGRLDFEASSHLVDASQADGAQGMWQLDAVKGIANLNTPTLSLQLGATSSAGQMIVAAVNLDSGATFPSIGDDASNTYIPVPGATAGSVVNNDTLVIMYVPNANAGATMVTATSTHVYSIVVWQFTTPQPATVDTAGQLSDQPSSTLPVSPSITTAGPGEIVIAIAVVLNTISSVQNGSPFTNDTVTNGNGFAHLTDPHAPAGTYQAVWNQPNSAAYCSQAVAFVVGQ
jgi:hypothetical protein